MRYTVPNYCIYFQSPTEIDQVKVSPRCFALLIAAIASAVAAAIVVSPATAPAAVAAAARCRRFFLPLAADAVVLLPAAAVAAVVGVLHVADADVVVDRALVPAAATANAASVVVPYG